MCHNQSIAEQTQPSLPKNHNLLLLMQKPNATGTSYLRYDSLKTRQRALKGQQHFIVVCISTPGLSEEAAGSKKNTLNFF